MDVRVVGEFEEARGTVEDLLARREDAIVVNAGRGDEPWFRSAVRGAEAGLFDFDGTLIEGNQWADVASLMTPKAREEDRADAETYFRRADGEPPDEEVVRFVYRSVRRMCDSRVPQASIENAASRARSRDGAAALLASFPITRSFDQRSAIISFGLRDYINAWCTAALDVSTPVIAATRLRFTPHMYREGTYLPPVVCGADPLTVITTKSKNHVAHAIIESFEIPMECVLVVGDSPTDLHMMMPGNLAVLVVPHRDDESSRAAFRLRGLEQMWPRVAAILVSDSLTALAKMRVPSS